MVRKPPSLRTNTSAGMASAAATSFALDITAAARIRQSGGDPQRFADVTGALRRLNRLQSLPQQSACWCKWLFDLGAIREADHHGHVAGLHLLDQVIDLLSWRLPTRVGSTSVAVMLAEVSIRKMNRFLQRGSPRQPGRRQASISSATNSSCRNSSRFCRSRCQRLLTCRSSIVRRQGRCWALPAAAAAASGSRAATIGGRDRSQAPATATR